MQFSVLYHRTLFTHSVYKNLRVLTAASDVHPLPAPVPLSSHQAVLSLWFVSFPQTGSLVSCLAVLFSLCNCVDCSLPGCSVHGVSQARLLVWAAIPPSPGDIQDPHINDSTWYLSFSFLRTSFSMTVSAMLLQMALVPSLWLSSTPLYICPTSSLSIHSSMDI